MRARIGWVLLPLLLGTATQADDWRQFQRDELRSNASRDRVPVPLTEIWTSMRPRRLSEAVWHKWRSPCVVNEGRVFYITLGPHAGRMLTGADARTGAIAWQTPLNRVAPGGGNLVGDTSCWTGVTRTGSVVAYDSIPPLGASTLPNPRHAPPVRNGSIIGNSAIRVFHPDTGGLLDSYALLSDYRVPIANPVDNVHRLFIKHMNMRGDWIQFTAPYLTFKYPDETGWFWGPELPSMPALGPPLISGNEIAATDGHDTFFRWTPNYAGQYYRVTHGHWKNSVLHPEDLPHNPLDQYPMVRLKLGYLIADMARYKHLTAFNPSVIEGHPVLWHVDIVSSIGIPSASESALFFGANGPSADQTLASLDAVTGALRWVYPSGALVAESVHEHETAYVRPVTPYQPGTIVERLPDDERSRELARARARSRMRVHRWEVDSAHKGAHRLNRGLVIAGGRVFGIVGDQLVGLEQGTGKAAWSVRLPAPGAVVSLAGTRTHVLVSHRATALGPATLSAYRIKDGKLDWRQDTGVSGQVAVASGVVFLGGAGRVHAFAPAERTFTLGIDSSQAADYRPIQFHEEEVPEPPVEGGPAPGQPAAPKPEEEPGTEKATPEQEAAWKRALGEVSVLRLSWDQTAAERMASLRARMREVPGVPLLISMEWLNPTRSTPMTGSRGWWTQAERKEFAAACADLARVSRPLYFDIAPEIGIYLARFPARVPDAVEFVRTIGGEIRAASPATQIIVSFNADQLVNGYGQTSYVPFAAVPNSRPSSLARFEPLLDAVDVIGLTLRPETAYNFAMDIPSGYLLPLRKWFGGRAVAITGIYVRPTADTKLRAEPQSDFLNKMLQACYWMELRLVAAPVDGTAAPAREMALRNGNEERRALGVWRATNAWRLVRRLSSDLRLAPAEAMPPPEPE